MKVNQNNESEEMYLENILVLQGKQDVVRAIDVVHYSGYSKPSVSRAMGLLRGRGYIEVDGNGAITLTKNGFALASKILERHRLLSGFLITLGVSEKNATEDACKIEHVISDESFEKIKEHVAKGLQKKASGDSK